MAGVLNAVMVDTTKTWDDFIKLLEEKLPALASAWLPALEPVSELFKKDDNGIFLIKSSQNFGINFLTTRHLREIEDALKEFSGLDRSVRFVLDENAKKKKIQKTKEAKAHIDTAIKLENLSQMHSFCGLNLKYTFENFVEGENSKFAYNIAKQIAENPGQKYNPLFISGSVGIGKTHLMQAIGHKILKNFPNLKIRYTVAEEFTNTIVESLNSSERNEKMKRFRDTYRNVDVLLIDDIQFIEGKKRTEDEIFNTFNALYHAGKQIVFASDRPLSSYELLPDRLKSRFEWGIEVKINVPDFETRTKIILQYAQNANFPISQEVAEFLAKTFSSNVRELEGAYNRASAMASIDGVELTVEKVKEYLELDKIQKKISVKDIIEACSKYFDVEYDDILSTARAKEVVNARKYAIYLTREMLDLSYPTLAKEFKKNHTTVMYQFDKMKKDLTTSKAMRVVVDEIKSLIKK